MSDESNRNAGSETQEQFYVDEFFETPEDEGVTVPVQIRGRSVPITFKRGLTIEDKAKAEQAAIKRRFVGGKMVIDQVSESEAVVFMLAAAIKDWPFQDRKTGQKLPVTPDNIRRMLGGADAMAEIIKTIDAEGAEALVPFVAPSTED